MEEYLLNTTLNVINMTFKGYKINSDTLLTLINDILLKEFCLDYKLKFELIMQILDLINRTLSSPLILKGLLFEIFKNILLDQSNKNVLNSIALYIFIKQIEQNNAIELSNNNPLVILINLILAIGIKKYTLLLDDCTKNFRDKNYTLKNTKLYEECNLMYKMYEVQKINDLPPSIKFLCIMVQIRCMHEIKHIINQEEEYINHYR